MLSNPNKIIDVRMLLPNILQNINKKLLKVNDCIIYIHEQNINVSESIYFKYWPILRVLIEGVGLFISSSRGQNKRIIGLRNTAVIVHAIAFIPYVLLNMSTHRPIINDKVITQFTDNVTGSRSIKYIYTNGTAILKRQILLHIICKNTIIKNININVTAFFVIFYPPWYSNYLFVSTYQVHLLICSL